MVRHATVPAIAASYFGISRTHGDPAVHPVIEQVFTDGRGWRRLGYRKRVSLNAARQLRKDGVSSVSLRCGARLADFRIQELVR